MAIQRVTQNMLSQRSLTSLQTGLTKLADLQEKVSTGRLLNRPSDDPAAGTSAMRTRDSLAAQQQYKRNAEDATSWMDLTDSVLDDVTKALNRVKDLTIQARNPVAESDESRQAIATEIDSLREHLLSLSNSTHLGRPVFGGITAGNKAFDANGAFVGISGEVRRGVADGVILRIDLTGPEVFPSDAGGANIFSQLTDLAAAVRAKDFNAITDGATKVDAATKNAVTSRANLGATQKRVEDLLALATDTELRLTASLSGIENVDLPKALVDLKMQEMAYQAALGSTAKVMQPSLMDFLR